jgi:cytidine/deoxycytidylate deaminase-like protein
MKQHGNTKNAPGVAKKMPAQNSNKVAMKPVPPGKVANAKQSPIAPPVYRPLPQPAVLQRKTTSTPARTDAKSHASTTPHIYRPQPVPRVLQTKNKQTGKGPGVPSNLVQKFSKLSPVRHGIRNNANTIQRSEGGRQSAPPWTVREPVESGKWKKTNTAGMHVPEIAIQTGGEGEMYATVYVPTGRQGFDIGIQGEFSTGLHAEMHALQKACSQGYELVDIQRIVIGREPCQRCAVIINALGLGDRVRYKASGQKEYNTWGFPDLTRWGMTPARLLNLDFPDSNSSKELLRHFSGTKWF